MKVATIKEKEKERERIKKHMSRAPCARDATAAAHRKSHHQHIQNTRPLHVMRRLRDACQIKRFSVRLAVKTAFLSIVNFLFHLFFCYFLCIFFLSVYERSTLCAHLMDLYVMNVCLRLALGVVPRCTPYTLYTQH